MRLRVRDILEAEAHQRSYAFAETIDLEGGADPLPPARVEGHLRVVWSERHLWIGGELEGQVTLECIRCLQPFQQTIPFQMEELCLLSDTLPPDAPEGEERWTEEGEYQISPEGEVDVTEMVRQNLLLAWPMMPLCRPDCPGLWPAGGTAREEGAAVDPRLAKLQAWLEKQE
jgi:uncharacterized protein